MGYDTAKRREEGKYALSALMRFEELLDAAGGVTEHFFSDADLKEIFRWITEFQSLRVTYPGMKSSFCSWLSSKNFRSKDDPLYLMAYHLGSQSPVPEEGKRALLRLREFVRLDGLDSLAKRLGKTAREEGLQEALELGRLTIEELSAMGHLEYRTFEEAASGAYFEDLERRCMHYIQTGEVYREGTVSTGFPKLDLHLEGLRPGRLVVVGARPGGCKSTFCLQVANNVASQGFYVGFVSLEMSEKELTLRVLSQRVGIPTKAISDGRLTRKELEHIRFAIHDTADPANQCLTIFEAKGRPVTDLRKVAKEWKRESKLDLLVIDYLQIIPPEYSDKSQPRHVQVATISRSLKLIAQELEICVLVAAQLSRELESRGDPTPRLADLRESGSIEQDADQVILLDRPEVRNPNVLKGILNLHLRKNRHGECVSISCEAHLATSTIKELDYARNDV